MAVWNLDPGAEQPIPITRNKGAKKAPDLTPVEIARRAQELGARVEFKDGKYRIYPPDRTKSPVFMSEKFGDPRSSRNAISELRHAGLDVLTEPQTEQETPTMAPTPGTRTAPKPGPSTTARAAAALEQQFKDLFELVTTELEKLNDRVDDLETRLAATPGAPPAKDPNADLDEAILAFMQATPIKLTAPVIAANLTLAEPVNAERVAGRLDTLAELGTVTASGEPENRLYHAEAPTSRPRSA